MCKYHKDKLPFQNKYKLINTIFQIKNVSTRSNLCDYCCTIVSHMLFFNSIKINDQLENVKIKLCKY